MRMAKRKIAAKLKTRETEKSVKKFLDKITDKKRREDCYTVLEMMKRATKAEPKMWGTSIVGFGSYHYKYESGREGDWFQLGFSSRKQSLTLYIIVAGFEGYGELLKKLGNLKTGRSCLYINSLEDIDMAILEKIFKGSVAHLRTIMKQAK